MDPDHYTARLPMKRKTQTKQASRERGSVMILAAITLTAMLLFSSIVIDVGYVMLLRRQDQAAADSAALGGIWDIDNPVVLTATVVEILNLNMPNANFTVTDLNTCLAEPLPPGWATYSNANCLAHNGAMSELRVRVPPQFASSTFASLAGIGSLEHSAFAQATASSAGGVYPFLVASGTDGVQCLKAAASIPSGFGCDANLRGSFGDLDITQFGSTSHGTTKDCNGTTSQLLANIAGGIDHSVSIYDQGVTPELRDDVTCGMANNQSLKPNTASPGQGNQANPIGKALFGDLAAGDGGPSRLRRTSNLSSFESPLSFGGGLVDDTPLWAFIDPGLNSSDHVPASCHLENFVGDTGGLNADGDSLMSGVPLSVANYLFGAYGLSSAGAGDRTTALMERCFAHYRGVQWTDHGG